MRIKPFATPCFLAAALALPTVNFAAVAPDAAAVLLRSDCGTLDDCFATMPEVNQWISDTRLPSATSPLLVDIGPGSFGGFSCNNSGWTTLRGSGTDNTTVDGVDVRKCTQLTFQDMSIAVAGGSGTTAIFWRGGGRSTWSNIEVSLTGTTFSQVWAWNDRCGGSTDLAEHYWFGSKITSSSGFYNTSFESTCGDTWFFGGEITAISGVESGSSNNLLNDAVNLGQSAILRVFGSVIRSIALPNNTVNFGHPMRGVWLRGSSTFHMHGGIINVDGSKAIGGDRGATAIVAPAGTRAHVLDTTFVVKPPGNSSAARLSGPGASSPFQWPNSDEPPTISSQNGADMFVETDCDNAGNCNAAGTETHLMVYNTACVTDGPWFDIVTGKCRGQ